MINKIIFFIMINPKSLAVFLFCVSVSLGLRLMPYHTVEETVTTEVLNHGEEELHLQTTGGFTNVPVNQANQQIDNYIRAQIPELKDAQLIKVETQVVNGINYGYTYQVGNTVYSVLVWDQPADRTRQIQGIAKIATSTNAQGQTVKTTTITKLSQLKFNEAANRLFQ